MGLSEHCANRLIRCGPQCRSCRQAILNRAPKQESRPRGEIVRLTRNNLACKILGSLDVVGRREEVRLSQDNATNLRSADRGRLIIVSRSSDSRDRALEVRQSGHSVFLSKCIPRQIERHVRIVSEKAAANYRIYRRSCLQKPRCANWLPNRGRRRPPEVYLVNIVESREEI